MRGPRPFRGSFDRTCPIERAQERALIDQPRFDVGERQGGGSVRRGVRAVRIGDHLVTTVLDLNLAHYGVCRERLPVVSPAELRGPTSTATS